jgi:ornithine cyclodeaminase
MMNIFHRQHILQAIDLKNLDELILCQWQAFLDYSKKHIHVPHPMHLYFPKVQGDCHIKAGFRHDGENIIIKVATGFYQNPLLGLPSSDGTILVYSQKDGLLKAILSDGGILTTLRTALAAAVAIQHTPWSINNISIIGTGLLAEQILSIMQILYPKATFTLWGRSRDKAQKIGHIHKDIIINLSLDEIINIGDVIITATASSEPIIKRMNTAKKTHIIALGADDKHKHECAPEIFKEADAIIVDAKDQALHFGDTSHALKNNFIAYDNLLELGSLHAKQLSESKNIITNLTGIAAQDIAIVEYALKALALKCLNN